MADKKQDKRIAIVLAVIAVVFIVGGVLSLAGMI